MLQYIKIFIVCFAFLATSSNYTLTYAQKSAPSLFNWGVNENPVSSQFEVSLQLPQLTDVELSLVSTKGKLMKFLMKQELMAGEHSLPFVVSDVPNGTYLLKIVTPTYTNTRALTVNNPTLPSGGGMLTDVQVSFTNPVRSGDDITLKVSKMTPLTLTLQSTDNQVSKLLMNQELMVGEHQATVIVSDLPNGNYFLKIETPTQTASKMLQIENAAPQNVMPLSGPYVVKNVLLSFDNPVRSGNNLKLKIRKQADVQLTIEDRQGKFSKLLMHQELMVGEHEVPVFVGDLPEGIYFLKLDTGDQKETKMIQIAH